MNGRTLTVGAAFTGIVATLIWAFGDHLVALLTPELVAHLVGLAYIGAKALLSVLLVWIVGMPAVNSLKWQFVEPDEVQKDGTPRWTSFRSRRTIRGISFLVGGIPLTVLLAAVFWPLTVLGWILVLICGFGLGGFCLSPVYEFTTGSLVPLMRRAVVGVKRVIGKDGKERDVPADTPPDEYDRTKLPDRTEPGAAPPSEP